MTTADTNRASLYIFPERNWGETPSTTARPKMYQVRMTGETLGHTKETVTSNTIRADRMREAILEVGAMAEGDISFELVTRDWDLMLEGILANDTIWLYEETFTGTARPAYDTSTRRITTSNTVADGNFSRFVTGAEAWITGPLSQRNQGRFTIVAVATDGTYIEVEEPIVTMPAGDANTGSDWTIRTDRWSAVDIALTSTTLTSASASFPLLNIEASQVLIVGGVSDASSGLITVSERNNNSLTLEADHGLTPFTSAMTNSAWIGGKRVKNGFGRKSFLIEKHFEDVEEYIYFTGMRPSSMSLNIESRSLVTGSFSFMGKEGKTSTDTVSGSRVDASALDTLNATTNVGEIKEGGTDLSTAIKSITLEINNNLRSNPKVGSRTDIDKGYGFLDVTGTAEAYFEDTALYQKMINHTESSLDFRFTDNDGNVMRFLLPRLYFTAGNPTSPGGNDDVMIPLEFMCAADEDTEAVVIIDLLKAV